MWGSIDSDMFKAYAHLTNADIDAAVAREAGISLPSQQKKSKCLAPQQCTRCYTINAPTQRFCGQCGLELTQEAKEEMESADRQLNAHLTTPEGVSTTIHALQRTQVELSQKSLSNAIV